jgi:hypothetical protein
MRESSKPAFPFVLPTEFGYGTVKSLNEGMDMRAYFAAHCPINLREAWETWTKTKNFNDLRSAAERKGFMEWFAILRFEYADAMLMEAEGIVSPKPSYTAADLRNLFGALNFIERSELETAAGTPLSNDAWEDFPASLPGMFKKLNDDRQEAVAALISRKIGA